MITIKNGFRYHHTLGRVCEVGLRETMIGQLTRLKRGRGFRATFWAYRAGTWHRAECVDYTPRQGTMAQHHSHSAILYAIYNATLATSFAEGQPMSETIWQLFDQEVTTLPASTQPPTQMSRKEPLPVYTRARFIQS